MQANDELYKQFAQEYAEVQALAERIERISGFTVEIRPTQNAPKWGFYAKYEENRNPKNFAYARKRETAKCLRISTKEDWAIRAGVDKSRYCVSPKGWWGKPAAYMDIKQDDDESLQEVASILAEVCKARHR
jgi:hypothetical protein